MFLGMLFILCTCNPQSSLPQAVTTHSNVMTSSPAATKTRFVLAEMQGAIEATFTPENLATITPGILQEEFVPTTIPLTITILYDNREYDKKLKPAWGFSALVEYSGETVLFDTGGDGTIFMENMYTLGIEPTQIESVILSHAHGDHIGGLSELLKTGVRPVVYLLPSFPASFKSQTEQVTPIIEVSPGQSIATRLLTTGEMGNSIPEQALVIQTEAGLVVITGCAHPGIVEIVEQAQSLFDESVHLVLGGFHLGNKNFAEIDSILREFRRIEVEWVAPCHCTGQLAIDMFAAEYGDHFIQVGVGKVIRLDAMLSK